MDHSYGNNPVDRDVLECVQEILAHMQPDASSISDVRIERSLQASSYDVNVVTVTLADGRALKIFMKDFGYSMRLKHEPDRKKEREMRVYRDILSHADLGTARYLGARWDAERGRTWLFLEYVEGTSVRNLGLPYWIAAAGWIGRLQGYFAGHSELLADAEFLERHDKDFFEAALTRAIAVVSQLAPDAVGRVGSLARSFRAGYPLMTAPPLTLVHGAYRPQNLLVRKDSAPPSICAADWERAALGSTLFDFAWLTDGYRPPILEEMWAAYRQGAEEFGVDVGRLDDALTVIACFRLYRVINWLAKAIEQRYSLADVEELLALGEQIASEAA